MPPVASALARRTLVKKPIVLHSFGQISTYYIFKNVGIGIHVNDFVVNLIQAWLQIGRTSNRPLSLR